MTSLSFENDLKKAKDHLKKGEIGEAKKIYQALLKIFPNNINLQQKLILLNKHNQTNANHPSPEVIDNLIKLFHNAQFSYVIARAKVLTKKHPKSFMVWNILGAAYKGLGKIVEASQAFKKVSELNPTYPDSYNNLAIMLQAQDKLGEAVKLLKKAISLKPESAIFHNNLGLVYQNQGNFNQAINAYQKALSLKPNNAEAYLYLGNIFQNQGKFAKAIEAFNKALAINIDYAEAYNNKGITLQSQDKLTESIEAFNNAIALNTDYAEAYNNKGITLQNQGKLKEAMRAFKKAVTIKTDYAEAYSNMGVTLKYQDKLDEAIEVYKKAIFLKPDYAAAYRNLSVLIKYKPENSDISIVEKLLKRPKLKDEDRCKFLYTLAKMKDDVGDIKGAFENYVAGGTLRQKILEYDIKEDRHLFAKLKNMAPIMKKFPFRTSSEIKKHFPIFILGMPRSGTTLVEQIISSHSKVQGCGELPFLNKFGALIATDFNSLQTENLKCCREAYLYEIDSVSNGSAFFTDKTPHNFRYVGLILKLFPEAKIIHVNRDPFATCWSNFKNYFTTNGLGYSYDLNNLVEYFKLYKNLMKVWENLYNSKIYQLSYEKLVIEQNKETRKLIRYLGLDWETACLSPQKNKRIVRTASHLQVREKVYRGSTEAWRKFEPYLKDFFNDLKDK